MLEVQRVIMISVNLLGNIFNGKSVTLSLDVDAPSLLTSSINTVTQVSI